MANLVLRQGATFLTRGGKMATVKGAAPFMGSVLNADGTFYRQAFFDATGTARSTDRALDIVAELPANTECAVEWLAAHSQKIIGITLHGVCVHDIGGEGYNIWLPAKRTALRDFMNY